MFVHMQILIVHFPLLTLCSVGWREEERLSGKDVGESDSETEVMEVAGANILSKQSLSPPLCLSSAHYSIFPCSIATVVKM